MPTPSTKKIISVEVANATSDFITIHNATQGWKKRVQCRSGMVLYNPADDGYTIAENDKIYVYLNERLKGNGSGTMSKGGIDISVTGTVDNTSRMVNL